MDARSVERAEAQLHELELQERGDFLLAALAVGVALAASRLLSPLAAPLLVGGLGVTLLGVRALVRRYLLLEDLAADRDAYVIPEVRQVALRAASLEHRHVLAGSIRDALDPPWAEPEPRVASNRDVLDEIATALDDPRLALDPASAVALDRLLTDGDRGLYSPDLPADELRSRLRRILGAFTPAPPTAE
jgi:hypothetical protein